MSSTLDPLQTLLKRLCQIELTAIAILTACHLFFLPAIDRLQNPISPMLAAVGLVALTPFCLLLSRPNTYARRFALICAELALLTFSASLGVTRLFSVLYMIIVAKAGLALGGKGLAQIIALAVVLHIVCKEVRYMITEPAIYALTPLQHFVHVLIYGRVANFALGIVLAATVTIAVLQERRSRLERERLNREVESMATQVERTRVAREIHDSVGHSLTSLNMQLEFAQKCLKKQPQKVQPALDLVEKLSEQARIDLQGSLRSPDDVELNLREEITALAKSYKEQGLFQPELALNFPELSNSTKHELFFVIKECMNNVKKYAEASRVTITAAQSDEQLRVVIEDDGKGFDPAVARAKSFGMRGMAERVRLLNGDLKIESAPGEGATITISIPLAAAKVLQS